MDNLPYREGANALILDDKNNFLLVQKQNYDDNQWDFPGGGIKEKEKPLKGVLRELKEELGTNKFKLIKKSSFVNKFEWPQEAREHGFKKHGKWWRGQKKHQFVFKFTGEKESIKPQIEEIRKVKWVQYSQLKNHLIFEGQWENAKKVIAEVNLH